MKKQPALTIRATHAYVEDPDLTATLQTWARLLAESLRKSPAAAGDRTPEPHRQ